MDIKSLRDKIDSIDKEILKLLNQRAEIAREIGEIKLSNSMEILDKKREKSIIRRIKALNTGPLTDESVAKIFSEIILACRMLQNNDQ